jgi:hypothetical protein
MSTLRARLEVNLFPDGPKTTKNLRDHENELVVA